MPTETIRRYDILKTRTQTFPCPGSAPLETYSLLESGLRYVTTNDPLSYKRVKPPAPLWAYPTNLPTQSTIDYKYGRESYQVNGLAKCQDPYGWFPTVVKNYSNSLIGAVPFSGEAPDWETDMRDHIKDNMVNLASSIAEYRQTATTFVDFARTVESGAQSIVREHSRRHRGRVERNIETIRRVLCATSAIELVTAFGVRPLINDIFASVSALSEKIDGDAIWGRHVVTKRDTDEYTTDFGTYTNKVSLRAMIYAQIDPGGRGGFTTGNPLEILWEAVPFSFVLDWAIPIGSWLSSLDAMTHVKQVIGTVTSKHESSARQIAPSSSAFTLESPATSTYKAFQRSPIFEVPIPRIPRWEPSTSYHSLINATSLLLNMRCRAPRR